MINEKAVSWIIDRTDTVKINGHFVYESGQHSSIYVNPAALYQHQEDTNTLCRVVAHELKDNDIEAVIASSTGSAIFSFCIAHHLSELICREVLSVWANRETEPYSFVAHSLGNESPKYYLTIDRYFRQIIVCKNVLIFESILMVDSMSAIEQVIKLVNDCKGNVAGLATFCNYGMQNAAIKPLSLINIDPQSWEEKECPLCGTVPINTKVGFGKQYLALKPKST